MLECLSIPDAVAPRRQRHLPMSCPKNWLALVSFVFGLLVASSATCEEPKNRVTPARAARPAPLELKARRSGPLSLTPPLPFGLRLPKFLAFGSAPAPAARGSSSVPRATDCRVYCAAGPVTDRTRSTTSAILAGVGAAGVVTGVVLTFAKQEPERRLTLAPTFGVKLSGQRALASADWRF
jgi:hypothetical protein